MLIRVCMDCNEILGHKDDGRGDEINGVTHGICEVCSDERLKEIEEIKAQGKLKAANGGIIVVLSSAIVLAGFYWHFASAILN